MPCKQCKDCQYYIGKIGSGEESRCKHTGRTDISPYDRYCPRFTHKSPK